MIDYNLEEAIKSLVRIGKSIRSNFNIDDHNSNFFTNLIKYQFNDPSCEFDLNKGLLLHGNIGVGKTIAMMLFEKKLDIKYFPRRYKIVTCREVQMEFNKSGYDSIQKYSRDSFSKNYHGNGEMLDRNRPLTICFDDLGTEDSQAKHFGNSTNIMSEIILDRYEMFQRDKMITHFTSNLTASELKNKYGDRVVSRLREMVNDVVLGGEDRRC